MRKSNEEKANEVNELSKIVMNKIQKYTTNENDLLEYSKFMSNFYNYSNKNVALIQEQFEGAKAVGSYKFWLDQGYNVQKGERGIKMFVPSPITYFKDEKGNEKQLRFATADEKKKVKNNQLESKKVNAYKIGNVFDISQTNAPLEDLPKIFPNRHFNFEISNENYEILSKGIEEISKELGIEIKDMKLSKLGANELGAAKGAFVENLIGNEKEIVLNHRNTKTESLATSIHELAHAALHNKNEEGKNFSSSTKEFQAELTSYIVCNHYGMDTSEKAIPYIANWTKNGQSIEDKEKTLEQVFQTAKGFMKTIDLRLEKENSLSKSPSLDKKEGLLKTFKMGRLVSNIEKTGLEL